jgi:hypothetical protein
MLKPCRGRRAALLAVAGILAAGGLVGPAEAQQPARNMGPRHGVPPLTQGVPMSADFVEEMEDRIQNTKEVQRGRFARDSEGRTRLDLVFMEVPMLVTWTIVSDFDKKLVFSFHTGSDEIIKIPMPFGHPSDLHWAVSLPDVDWRKSSESDEPFAGLPCQKMIYQSADGKGTLTSWIARELRVVLFEVFETPSEKHTWKLTNIQRGEPEPALFELPPQ